VPGRLAACGCLDRRGWQAGAGLNGPEGARVGIGLDRWAWAGAGWAGAAVQGRWEGELVPVQYVKESQRCKTRPSGARAGGGLDRGGRPVL
jgi:hypothetical protein